MTIVINYTNKSGACPETLVDVKSYKETSLWSIEVAFNNGKVETFYAVESVKELSEPEDAIYELSYHYICMDTCRPASTTIAFSKSIDRLKEKAIDSNKNIFDEQWIDNQDSFQLDIGTGCYKDSYIIKQIKLI